MKLTCNTIQDMLPLVAEDLASRDTVKLIEDHIEKCPECRKEYEDLLASKVDYRYRDELESIPLKNVKRKLKNKNIYVGLLSALLVSVLLLIGLNIATKPIPLSFADSIKTTQIEDGKVFIEFKPEVSNYNIVSNDYDSIEYEIMAWKTNISNLFKRSEAKTAVINVEEGEPVIVRFISQASELDRVIYGKDQERYSLTLPKLTMNYYFLLMGIIFIISGISSFLFRKREKIKKVLNIIMIFAFSYILSHISILGFQGATHHINRDLSFLAITTILIFSIFMLLVYKDNFIKTKEKISK